RPPHLPLHPPCALTTPPRPPHSTLSLHDALPISRPGIRNLVLRDIRQPRLDAETLERLLQIAGELAQLLEHSRLAHVHDVIDGRDRKSTRLNSSHVAISYAVFCLKKKKY